MAISLLAPQRPLPGNQPNRKIDRPAWTRTRNQTVTSKNNDKLAAENSDDFDV
jgi:hypothetical protein